MTNPEQGAILAIGKLMLEQNALEKQIGKLRDQLSRRAETFAQIGKLLLFHPERLVFEGQTVDEQFSGESVIDRTTLDVDSLITEVRAAIVRKKACAIELAELGIDPDETEREQDQRNSRALFHPANFSYGPRETKETGGTKRDNLGFTKPNKKAGRDRE